MQTDMNLEEMGASITRAASLQTYATVRLLVDRDRVSDAYQAYGYFRWVDDWLDEPSRQRGERLAFLARQTRLVDECYAGKEVRAGAPEENMVISLIRKDGEDNSGLRHYIHNMMAVMAFDSERRGRLISQAELDRYARSLAIAVTEALHYFIGHDAESPHDASRYLAAEGAHITHMLRDTLEDNELGYFNIPREYIRANGISPFQTDSVPFRGWVRGRAQLARACFRRGRDYLARVDCWRCRIAGYAYIARFETVLDSIERDGYQLRPEYREAKGAGAGARMGLSVFWSALSHRPAAREPRVLSIR